MWLYFNEYGQLTTILEHGSPARAGSTQFKIFAVFEGIDSMDKLRDYSATIKLKKPDLTGSEYPTLLMNLASAEFIKESSETNTGNFQNLMTYYGFLFDFGDFNDSQEEEVLLDTQGLWQAVITLIKDDFFVQGVASFNVSGIGTEQETPDETVYEIVTNQIVHNLNQRALKTQTILVIANWDELDLNEYEEGQFLLRKSDGVLFEVIIENETKNLEQVDFVSAETLANALLTKVDKSSSANIVYGTDNSGNQITIPVEAHTGNIVRRKSNNQIAVPFTPTENTDASSKGYVDGVISTVKSNTFQVVSSLPQQGEEGIIYLVEVSNSVYERFIWETNGYISLGTTQIDLSNYVQKSTTIAGINLEDDISKSELVSAITDNELSLTSDNPVENKVIVNAMDENSENYSQSISNAFERFARITTIKNSKIKLKSILWEGELSQSLLYISGKNLIDFSDKTEGYIRNDAGNLVQDVNSVITNKKIPVTPGSNLYFNFWIQRLYLYDANGNWIGRTGLLGSSEADFQTTYNVPSNVYFVQTQTYIKIDLSQAMFTEDSPSNYEPSNVSLVNVTSSNYEMEFLSNGYLRLGFYDNVQFGLEYKQQNPDFLSYLGSIQKNYNVSRIFDINNYLTNSQIKITSFDAGVYDIKAIGKNLFNANTRVIQRIKNDSGNEAYDYSSFYYSCMIPVKPGEKLRFTNIVVQRFYYYDINGAWLRRTGASLTTANHTEIIPNDVYFIQIQCSIVNIPDPSNAQIESGEVSTSFEDFVEAQVSINSLASSPIYISLSGSSKIRLCTYYGNNGFSIEYYISSSGEYNSNVTIPECPTYSVWRPGFITDDYKQPIGRQNVTLSMTLDTFLSTFYDVYLGTNADGYKVVKKSIGHDASHRYEIYEYDFIPKNYNRVVLLSAGMNPCELPAEFGLAYLMNFIINNHDSDAGLKYLYENVRIKVLPCLNANKFDTTPKGYTNYNNIRINKNFNYKTSWDNMDSNQNKGTEPDSEEEVVALKKWLNDNANYAELYIDCHTDPDANTPLNIWAGCSDSATVSIASSAINLIISYYRSIGLDINQELSNYAHVTDITSYPKHQYAKYVCNMSSIQIEMWSNTTALGGDAAYMNDSADIQFYVCLLRQLILGCLVKGEETKTIDAIENYQSSKKVNFN